MKKNYQLSVAVLGVVCGLIGAVRSAEASVYCGVAEGANCENIVYYMKLCADITFRQGYCNRLCNRQEPICGAEDFKPWVDAYQDIGRRGIRGVLKSHANEFDGEGNLLFTSGRVMTACKRTLFGWRPVSAPKVCPVANRAGPGNCGAGTVFDTASNTCIVSNSDGSSGGADHNQLINQSNLLVSAQNQHFGLNPEVDPNLTAGASTGDNTTLPGLIDPNASLGSGLLNSVAGVFHSSNPTGGASGASTNNFGSSGSAALPSNPETTSLGGKSSSAQGSTLASTTFGTGEGMGSAGGSGGGANISGAGAGSWFTGKPSVGGAGGEQEFAQVGSGASRGLASANGAVEDPSNYFMMSDIGTSLFKRATAQFRKKEKDFVLNK